MEYILILLGFALIVWIQSAIYRRKSFDRLTYRCAFSKAEVFEGEEVELIETVENRKRLPLPWMKSQITVDKMLFISEEYSVVTDTTRTVTGYFTLPGRNRFERRWRVIPNCRGDYTISHVTLVASDLIGKAAFSKVLQMDAHLTVLPCPADAEITIPHRSNQWGETVTRAYFPEDPFFLSGVREYTGRESLNSIHWKATAKMQQLMAYRRECTANRSLVILLNMQSRSIEQHTVMDRDTVETAIRVCVSLLEETLSDSTPVQLCSNGTILPDRDHTKGKFRSEQEVIDICSAVSYGEEHVMQLLRLLSQVQLYTVEPFDRWLSHQIPDAAQIAIVSGYYSAGIGEFIRAQQERSDAAIRLYLCGKEEQEIPADIPVCSVGAKEVCA